MHYECHGNVQQIKQVNILERLVAPVSLPLSNVISNNIFGVVDPNRFLGAQAAHFKYYGPTDAVHSAH